MAWMWLIPLWPSPSLLLFWSALTSGYLCPCPCLSLHPRPTHACLIWVYWLFPSCPLYSLCCMPPPWVLVSVWCDHSFYSSPPTPSVCGSGTPSPLALSLGLLSVCPTLSPLLSGSTPSLHWVSCPSCWHSPARWFAPGAASLPTPACPPARVSPLWISHRSL